MDCGDFASQAAAQAYFIGSGGPAADPDRLDGDGDGMACDSLPCPCWSRATPVQQPIAAPKQAKSYRAKIVSFIDGDTVKVKLANSKNRRTVRLIGIDAPETKRPGVRVECGARAASKNMGKLAPIGAMVGLKTDPTQDRYDRYGRLLAYVSRKGKDLGHAQIKLGLATTYIYKHRPFQRATAYQASGVLARAAGRGVFGSCAGNFHTEQS